MLSDKPGAEISLRKYIMEFEFLYIEIDGQEIDDIYPHLISLEVELDDQLVGMFRMRLPLVLNADGTWTHLDDERFSIWKPVFISAGFEDGMEDLITGYITHVRPFFDSELPQCFMEIWGMDESVLMDRVEILKTWPNQKDSDIAADIFNSYGFSPQIEDTSVVYEEAVSTIVQRETDMQFLNRLALRNGYECFVENSTACFRPPLVDEAPQPLLACQFGEETNVDNVSIEVNALTPTRVNMFQMDHVNKEIIDTAVESSLQTQLGANTADSYLPSGVEQAQVFINLNAATGAPEMEGLCHSYYHAAEWFVFVKGDIRGNVYGHVLKPRGTVTIKGIGETHSGIYYVSHVTHFFSGNGYKQVFKAKRNGLMPTGDEDFSGSDGLLGGVL
jgi:hypothetical protein